MRWLLPEAIEDVLPEEAARLEYLRRLLLDEFSRNGYEFVIPPMLEYIESLLTGSGRDLDLRTFKLMDQVSGRSLGIRADMTPQVARIDAHLLNRSGVVRLCYCGSVLHTVSGGFQATREPIQIGAEIYGHEGLEADIEIIRLLARSFQHSGLTASRIDLGHVRIFRALVNFGNIDDRLAQELFAALQVKDIPEINALTVKLDPKVQRAMMTLPELYGGAEVLQRAKRELVFAGDAGLQISSALEELERLAITLAHLPISFDLADLRGYHYHGGVAFSAYASGSASAVARGGRYDNVSKAFGRARWATGFSMDLREMTRLSPFVASKTSILAPWSEDDSVLAEVERLRAAGERVVQALPGHEGDWHQSGCDRRLVRQSGGWVIEGFKDA